MTFLGYIKLEQENVDWMIHMLIGSIVRGVGGDYEWHYYVASSCSHCSNAEWHDHLLFYKY